MLGMKNMKKLSRNLVKTVMMTLLQISTDFKFLRDVIGVI